MSKKKNKSSRNAAKAKADAPLQLPKVVTAWEEYMGEGKLEDFQRLMRDLGFEEHFPSKSKCRQALKAVWVNIPDFLYAIQHGLPVHHFPSERELSNYTLKSPKRIYPKRFIPKGSPLRQLLAHILGGGGKGRNNDYYSHKEDGLLETMARLSLAG
ncbi:hypothetical protein NPX13_g321 [Xylaria arbuscula]|uniref:Uncharacterized protein n=1 Tax=Xylaria arbuscula TaxID=114810 RepID=A0A9W8TSH6_9PEZI|nr:hypothetical protein NPX13_g321 [Xylaria arbuscula]